MIDPYTPGLFLSLKSISRIDEIPQKASPNKRHFKPWQIAADGCSVIQRCPMPKKEPTDRKFRKGEGHGIFRVPARKTTNRAYLKLRQRRILGE